MHIGIIREGKNPPDMRVPLSPVQCREIMDAHPQIRISVQESPIRCFPDDAYRALGITVIEDMNDCDLILGVKEIPLDMLIPGKAYMFFSHTIKEQPYNRKLLQEILQKRIQLIDYETLTTPHGHRLLGFGRYAGIVGAYNTFLAYGKKTNRFELKPAHECRDRIELEEELKKVHLPSQTRIAITGGGRVAGGAVEILSALKVEQVSAEDFLLENYDNPVYVQLHAVNYFRRKDGTQFTSAELFADPTDFESDFLRFAKRTDILITCHYWDSRSPYLFTRDDARAPGFNIRVVGDISCDIDGPIASTIRPSTIEDPLYGYDPYLEKEVEFMDANAIGVMAVDNLPCELPRDASEDFGREWIDNVLPALTGDDREKIIDRASITNKKGQLTEHYAYLEDYVKG
jgi:alanine dehydrogenase